MSPQWYKYLNLFHLFLFFYFLQHCNKLLKVPGNIVDLINYYFSLKFSLQKLFRIVPQTCRDFIFFLRQ